ncbi:MAG: hypothetical protein UR28_C0001G0033 [Candidatus Peregrinibacteria bacterium GW2011_GWF2_33_10]|nr:MAG: hypothetical protein UR28_C0001G0033 [Candidatus Peregrinibacteria bacterium GW2011_GWF2_33_10]OGJ44781.1 MAG: hypothetical protein A2263_06095 [Candidatus Peregrinibacteria bacterium RIFOXYA2_FULL_33_21]OGJ50467.1 MAG: hypothetical protein A2307_02720 [Candidatus Peregrinibacteria bacterium RIFOXYB2_FULL_33_20]
MTKIFTKFIFSLLFCLLISNQAFTSNIIPANDINLNLNDLNDSSLTRLIPLPEKTILLAVPDIQKDFFVVLKDLGLNDDLSLDTEEVKIKLQEILGPYLPIAQSAKFVLKNKKIIIQDGSAGLEIDFKRTIEQLQNQLNTLDLEKLTVYLQTTNPKINTEKLSQYQKFLENKIQSLTIISGSNSWELEENTYLPWLEISPQKTLKCDFLDEQLQIKLEKTVDLPSYCQINEELNLDINQTNLEQYINEQIRPKIEKQAQNVKIYFDQNEKIVFEGTAVNGQKVDDKSLSKFIAFALANNIQKFELPVIEIKAQVQTDEKLQKLGVKELVSMGWSNFVHSSAARIYNVKFGINKYNGLLIAPGEKFSFVDHLGGPVTNKTGWKSELVIKGKETIPEAGGGLCQVSTTFYRAALNGGYEINERSGHSYAVSYYANPHYGMDCTVYPGSKDCIMTNDSGYYILIQTYTEGLDAYFKFYSTSDGRQVKFNGPYYYGYNSASPVYEVSPNLNPGQKQLVENAHTGFNVDWYRTIVKNGLPQKTEKIHTSYRAVPAKYIIGSDSNSAQISDFE